MDSPVGATRRAAQKIVEAVGRPDLAEQPWFATIEGRLAHARELDEAIGTWTATHDRAEALELFAHSDATAAPVYDIADIAADPHFRERGSFLSVDHPQWGEMLMQGLIAQLELTPGAIRWTGPQLGEHNVEILVNELGVSTEQLDELIRAGVAGGDPASAGR